ENAGANSGSRTARCFGDWRCGRRPLLPSLLCPIDSSACTARGILLCATLVPDDSAAPLAAATWDNLPVPGSRSYYLLNHPLPRLGCAAQTVGDRTLFARAFCSKRQDFRLGSEREDLSAGAPASCLSLHHNLSADGPCFRGTRPRFGYP